MAGEGAIKQLVCDAAPEVYCCHLGLLLPRAPSEAYTHAAPPPTPHLASLFFRGLQDCQLLW